MDLRVLEYFLAAAEEENISRAAQLLHVSQPTVSRQLMDLEYELGKKLFIRTNKKVMLTPDGLLFRETAQDILRLYDKAKSSHEEEKELTGEICIGAAEIESFDVIAEKIAQFSKDHPKVVFHLYSGNAEEVSEGIDKGILDIGIILKSLNTLKYEILDLGIRERWGVAVHKDHRFAGMQEITEKDLRHEKVIIPENQYFRSEMRELAGFGKNAVCTYTLVKNALILCEKGNFPIVCLEMHKYINGNLVFIPFVPERTAQVFAIWKKKAVYSEAMNAFLKTLDMQE